MADTKRLSRRMAGLLKARLPDLRLEAVRDPRKARGKRWPLAVVLRMCNEQWLYMIRQHWCVENHCHQTWDMAYMEDDHPWIENDPQGTLVVMLLRRMAYNLMSLFRSVSQRADHRRQIPWKDVMRWLYNALISVDESQISTLRQRPQQAITD